LNDNNAADLPYLQRQKIYYRNKLGSFYSLWKLDDKVWVKKRLEDWEIIKTHSYSDYPKAELHEVKQYFLKGEQTRSMNSVHVFLCTPLDSAKCMQEFFYSEYFSENERESLLLSLVYNCFTLIEGLSWSSKFSEYVRESLLGDTNINMLEYVPGTIVISEPENACEALLGCYLQILEQKNAYTTVHLDWFDYMISTMLKVEAPKNLNKNLVDELFEAVELVMSSPKIAALKAYEQNTPDAFPPSVKTIEDAIKHVPNLPELTTFSVELAYFLKEHETLVRDSWYYNRAKE